MIGFPSSLSRRSALAACKRYLWRAQVDDFSTADVVSNLDKPFTELDLRSCPPRCAPILILKSAACLETLLLPVANASVLHTIAKCAKLRVLHITYCKVPLCEMAVVFQHCLLLQELTIDHMRAKRAGDCRDLFKGGRLIFSLPLLVAWHSG